MRSPTDWLADRLEQPVIAVIRASDPDLAWKMADAVVQGGIQCLEVTWGCAQAPDLIPQFRRAFPHCSIGTGTILTPEQMQCAIATGAEFIFSPHTNPALIQQAVAASVAVIPGALTPSEIIQAWQSGATAVKIFPVASCGGVTYIKHLRPVLGDIPLIPTGGVTIQNASEFLAAGAIAVGLAGDLFPRHSIETQNWSEITARAKHLLRQTHAPHRAAGLRQLP